MCLSIDLILLVHISPVVNEYINGMDAALLSSKVQGSLAVLLTQTHARRYYNDRHTGHEAYICFIIFESVAVFVNRYTLKKREAAACQS